MDEDERDESDESEDTTDYNSGPYCRHWNDPADCDAVCGTCGHTCGQHVDALGCRDEHCPCEDFTKPQAET